MAPDADKDRKKKQDATHLEKNDRVLLADKDEGHDATMELVLKRVVTDFSYIEKPVRCFLKFKPKGASLSCNEKKEVILARPDSVGSEQEFALIDDGEGSLIVQNTKTKQVLCSNADGVVYASSQTCQKEGFEKWELTTAIYGGFHITSAASSRKLACDGNMICTRPTTLPDYDVWHVDLTSGELCFLSLASQDVRVRCDQTGKLSLSKHWLCKEAWRFSKSSEGLIRISPWADAGMFLSSNWAGEVSTTEKRGEAETWVVEKAPGGHSGLIIRSAITGRILCKQDSNQSPLCTIDDKFYLDDCCVWNLESVTRQTYYLACSDDAGRRLEATKKGSIHTRRLPLRILSEEWKIEASSDRSGIFTIYSNGAHRFLGSSCSGELLMMERPDGKGSEKWLIEEKEEGLVLISHVHHRILVCPSDTPPCTVLPGTTVVGCTRWMLEPKIPRPPPISKEKNTTAVGTEVAMGVATGSAVGAIGMMTHKVGIGGHHQGRNTGVTEALSCITRKFSLRSSDLLAPGHSMTRSDSTTGNERSFATWRCW